MAKRQPKQLVLIACASSVSLRRRKIRHAARERLLAYLPLLQRLSLESGELAETAARLDLLREESRKAVTRLMGRSNFLNLAKFAASTEGRAIHRNIERLGDRLQDLEQSLCG